MEVKYLDMERFMAIINHDNCAAQLSTVNIFSLQHNFGNVSMYQFTITLHSTLLICRFFTLTL